MVVGKYGLLAQKRGLKDSDNGWVNNLTPTCTHPQRFDSRLSHCSALRKSFKTASFRLSALPLAQCGLKTDLDPRQNRSFGFPQKRGFSFKTVPGLGLTAIYPASVSQYQEVGAGICLGLPTFYFAILGHSL